ncbi:MAG: TlpA disulfide reductase family protein [Mariprofundaceae bacterium]
MSRYSRLVPLLLVLWTFAPLALADPLTDMGVITPKDRMPAPDFSLPSLHGEERRLSDFKGRVVLLHFWATWCAPCRKEMPELHTMWDGYREQGLELLCVNVDRGNRKGVESFMQDIGLDFHTLLDAEGAVRNDYEVRALPTTYVIGRDGKFVGRIVGERNWGGASAEALFQLLLKEDSG